MQEQQTSHCTIAVFGLFGSSNLGNEATLAAFLQHLQQHTPDVRILTITPRRSAVDRTNGAPWLNIDPMPIEALFWRVRPGWLRRGAAALATAVTEPWRRRRAAGALQGIRALFVPGTGVVDDYGQGALDLPLHLDRWTAAARAVGARVVFCSIGVTTVRSPLSRWLFARSLRRANYRSFRDDASSDNARGFGVRAGSIVPDLAFGLQHPDPAPATAPPRTIGVGVMGYSGWNLGRGEGERVYLAYITRIQALCGQLLQGGYQVRLLVGDTAADARAVRDLSASHPRSGLIVAPIDDYRDLMAEIVQCDAVVATRYHNVLLALMLARPTLSIGYSDKNDALMRSMGQAAFCHAIDAFAVDTVVAQISEVAALGPAHGAELRTRAQQMRVQVIEQLETVLAAELTGCERSSRSAH